MNIGGGRKAKAKERKNTIKFKCKFEKSWNNLSEIFCSKAWNSHGQADSKCATRYCRCFFYGHGNLLNIQILSYWFTKQVQILTKLDSQKAPISFRIDSEIIENKSNIDCANGEKRNVKIDHERPNQLKWSVCKWKIAEFNCEIESEFEVECRLSLNYRELSARNWAI